MARKAEYTGGPWSIGGVRSGRPAVAPAVRRQLVITTFIPHCEQRISEGLDIYKGMLREYRLELGALSAQMARERATARRGAAATVKDLTVQLRSDVQKAVVKNFTSDLPEAITAATVNELTVQLPERAVGVASATPETVTGKPEKVAA